MKEINQSAANKIILALNGLLLLLMGCTIPLITRERLAYQSIGVDDASPYAFGPSAIQEFLIISPGGYIIALIIILGAVFATYKGYKSNNSKINVSVLFTLTITVLVYMITLFLPVF